MRPANNVIRSPSKLERTLIVFFVVVFFVVVFFVVVFFVVVRGARFFPITRFSFEAARFFCACGDAMISCTAKSTTLFRGGSSGPPNEQVGRPRGDCSDRAATGSTGQAGVHSMVANAVSPAPAEAILNSWEHPSTTTRDTATLWAMSAKKETQTGPTPTTQTAGGQFGHNPIQGRAHLVNRGDLEDEAGAGPGSLDPKTLAQSKVPEARRWLAKKGIELEVPAGWKYLGLGNEGRTLTFVSDTDASAHAVELHVWSLPDDASVSADWPAHFLAGQSEQLQEATELKRVLSWTPHTLGQVKGLLVIGWGPATGDAVSDEDLYLATDGTGRRAISWRGVVERPLAEGKVERVMVILALSSPLLSFAAAQPLYDAMIERAGVWE